MSELWIPGNVAGTIWGVLGIVLHGTRSGQFYDIDREFQATVNYVQAGAGGLGWNVTIGNLIVASHMGLTEWGWHIRGASSRYLGAEFAQANLGDWITDDQIEAFCWWFIFRVRAVSPNFPLNLVNHSDLPEGVLDGKTDVEPRGLHSVRDRILARLSELGVE